MKFSPGRQLLRNLGYAEEVVMRVSTSKQEAAFDFEDGVLDVAPIHGAGEGASGGPEMYRISIGAEMEWFLESKVKLSAHDLKSLCNLVARMAPVGSTAHLQADGHVAGTVFVGLILAFSDTRIPVNLVSGDIGCGLTLIPVVNQAGVHLTDNGDMDYYTYVLGCIRRSLKRGKIAEQGLTNSQYLPQASAFYGESELPAWLDEMKFILDTIGIDYHSKHRGNVLEYIGTFTQSLGSSGNHFMELATDVHNKHWIVIHSGSRALGAIVYQAIAEACRLVNDDYEIATGPLAVFYARAYAVLNKFAKMNRVACAVAVLDDMGLETSAERLRAAMERSEVFGPAVARFDGMEASSFLTLLGGLTHNGLKAFVNESERKIMYVLSKGAIAVDRHSSSAIVALRAGEGCIVFTLADPTCPWKEVPLDQIRTRGFDAFEQVFPDATNREDVLFAGHGAGRSQSASATARGSTFDDMAAFFARNEMVANIAPGVIGDNPEIAYKSTAEILPHLPLHKACTTSTLRTRVSHKEGLSFKKAETADCAEYAQRAYSQTRMGSLWMDWNLIRSNMTDELFATVTAERDALFASLHARYHARAE